MARTARRSLASFAVILTLLAVPLAAAGCGAGTHYVENVVAHKVANHFAKTAKEKRDVNRAFCAVSVYQAFRDLKGHHYLWGAITVHQALKNCEAGFAKSAG
jgi:hypothetical protein